MKEFIVDYRNELLGSLALLALLLILRFLLANAVRQVGLRDDIHERRTKLVIKYISLALSALCIAALILLWGIEIKEIGIIFSSVFAVLGVAVFAQWSILSNITAGIILFFSFPYKIGDRIRIMDKDFPEEAIIEDIKAFHINLVKDNGELLTYPNNLLLQKGVVILQKHEEIANDGTDF